ncbi:flagellar hook-length control protein FliK [Alicyclobacillus fructus]|uniref:flagellar hook-length control protein FliK n=1 Tax=Alicyclobacillus fructus TaxID=2816082 RepID=UPI001A8DB499|nr:flagellar hook-length control protein FliK [Alicyclobacillus fructus]
MDVAHVSVAADKVDTAGGKASPRRKSKMDGADFWAEVFAQAASLSADMVSPMLPANHTSARSADNAFDRKPYLGRESITTATRDAVPFQADAAREKEMAISASPVPDVGMGRSVPAAFEANASVKHPPVDERWPISTEGVQARSSDATADMHLVGHATVDARDTQQVAQTIIRMTGDPAHQEQNRGSHTGDPVSSLAPDATRQGGSAPEVRLSRHRVLSSPDSVPANHVASPSFDETGGASLALGSLHVAESTAFQTASVARPGEVPVSTPTGLGMQIQTWVTVGDHNGAKTLTVALEPKELGAVQVVVHHTDDGVAVQLVASTPAGATVLADQLPALIQQLTQAGVSVSEASVGLATDAGEDQGSRRERDGGEAVTGTSDVSENSRSIRTGYLVHDAEPTSLIHLYA